MKKAVLLASLLGITLASTAQVSFGPIIGIGIQGPKNYSQTDNTVVETITEATKTTTISKAGSSSSFYQPSAGLSFKIGAQVKIDLHPNFAISTGIAFQRMGYKISNPGSKSDPASEQKGGLNYISIPLIPQFQYPVNKKITIGLGIGPEINYFVGGKYTTSTTGFPSTTTTYKAKGSIDESAFNEKDKASKDDNFANEIDYIKPLNITLNIAPFVQFKLNGMSVLVSPTYYVGLSDIAPDTKHNEVEKITGTTKTTKTDIKSVSKTGGFGLNVSLLFGKTSGGNKRRK